MSTKPLPKEITSYDLLKTVAIITMVIDHIGFFFFPDQLIWRAIGRMSAPIWLFLIGYANSRDLSPALWIGAIILTVSNVFIAKTFFPVNILWGMLLVRYLIDAVAAYSFTEMQRLIAVIIILCLLYFPTRLLFDYGSFCMLMALYGYAVRRRLKGTHFLGVLFAILYMVLYVGAFGFKGHTLEVMIYGVSFTFFALYYFKPLKFPKLTKKLPRFVVGALHAGGRGTLEIYVVHVLIFKIAACLMGVEGFGLFEWSWF